MFVRNVRRALRSKLHEADREAAIEELRSRFRNPFRRGDDDGTNGTTGDA
jgi:hypothetical protein